MAEQEGEINVQATIGRRRITLDPIREIVLPVAWREVESTIPCGMRIDWIAGEVHGEEFDLAAGAGCGSPWMTFGYKGRGFCIDVTKIVEALIDFVDETEKETPQ